MGDADELLAADPQIRLITTESIPAMPVVKSLLPGQVQVIQATGRRITAALRRKRPAPSAAVRLDAGPTQVPRTTVSTFSFTNPSRPVKRARVASPPKGGCGRQGPTGDSAEGTSAKGVSMQSCHWLQPGRLPRLHRRQSCLQHCHRLQPGHLHQRLPHLLRDLYLSYKFASGAQDQGHAMGSPSCHRAVAGGH